MSDMPTPIDTRFVWESTRSARVGSMRTVVAASLLTVALLVVPALPSSAGGHGGAGHDGHGDHGGHGFHGRHGFHTHAVIVGGPAFWWGPWWDYPPPYAYPPPMIVAPPVYEPESYWYYCPSAKAYYPTAPTCPEVWIKVPPSTQ